MSTEDRSSERRTVEMHEASGHHAHYKHGHHHHHHHKKKKRRSLKDCLPKFMKKKQFWGNMAIIVAAVVLLTALGLSATQQQKKVAMPEQEQPVALGKDRAHDGTISVTVPFFRDTVSLVGSATQTMLETDVEIPTEQLMSSYRKEKLRHDEGLPVKLTYAVSGLPTDCTVEGATVEITETEGTSAPRVFELEAGQQELSVHHLKTGTQYDYRISVHLSNGTDTSVEASFQTMETPRILSIDGLVNVRDMGGWKTADGKTIRQGLLYRGSEMDGAVEPEFCLTAEGLEDMISVLGIRTDLDLRATSVNRFGTDPLGAGVEHIYIGAPDYEGIFTDWGRTCVQSVFSLLAQEDRYPVYLHCTYGMDRTGTFCSLLGAMLGMEEENLLLEYRLSSLYHCSVQQERMEEVLAVLDTYPGDTLQKKTESYLLSAGVTRQEIETIKQILLEP